MDKYIKWMIMLVILLVISISLIVYFVFYYNFDKRTSLSPETKEKNETNKSIGKIDIINEKAGNIEKDVPGIERKGDDLEKGNALNETNKTRYWIQDLPDSGGGTYSITPLIIYEKLGEGKRILLYMFLFVGLVIYIIVKITKNERVKKNKDDIC